MNDQENRLAAALKTLLKQIKDVGGFPRYEAMHGRNFDNAVLDAQKELVSYESRHLKTRGKAVGD